MINLKQDLFDLKARRKMMLIYGNNADAKLRSSFEDRNTYSLGCDIVDLLLGLADAVCELETEGVSVAIRSLDRVVWSGWWDHPGWLAKDTAVKTC